MKKSITTKAAFSCGGGALEYLRLIACRKAVVIADRDSQFNEEMTDTIYRIMTEERQAHAAVYDKISVRPTISELMEGVSLMQKERPDTVFAIGEEATINAAKIMLLLYEYPEMDFGHLEEADMNAVKLQTKLIVIPSTSGNAAEVSQVGTIMIDSRAIK